MAEPKNKPFPAADTSAAADTSTGGLYRPTRNWRYGKLYLEGQKYDLEGIPQDDIDSAIEQGHLEVC
jgi:hypothetical protein